MKNKITTYILIAVTLAVWGIIFFRITERKEVTTDVVVLPQKQNEPLKNALKLNYDNPFRTKKESKKTDMKIVETVVIEPPIFGYKGLIRSDRETFILIDDTLFRAKDKIHSYSVVKLFSDSLVVRKQGKLFTIRRNHEDIN